MEVKLLEIRDRATFIPVLAVLMVPSDDDGRQSDDEINAEAYLMRRAGFGFDRPLVTVVHLERGAVQWDPFDWTELSRTMRAAHLFIQEHWDELRSGSVVDVEYVLQEVATPKTSERRPPGGSGGSARSLRSLRRVPPEPPPDRPEKPAP